MSQAVAGVESRLDNILMDQEEAAKAESAKLREAENAAQPLKSPVGCMDSIPYLWTWLIDPQRFRAAHRPFGETTDYRSASPGPL